MAKDFQDLRANMLDLIARGRQEKKTVEQVMGRYGRSESNLEPEPQNPRPADKGECAGECNRTACRNKGIIVHWWNTGTNAWYCQPCAFRINATNPDLCLKRLAEAEAKQPNPENPCES